MKGIKQGEYIRAIDGTIVEFGVAGNQKINTMKKGIKNGEYIVEAPKVGHVYYLKDFTAPKVFNGLFFECLVTEQKIAANQKIVKDLGLLTEWKHQIYKPERFGLPPVPCTDSKPQNLKYMDTKIKSASVKVMLSYDYSHFEASMQLENDNGLESKDVDEARKTCQRLADKAVAQYKKAKEMANSRSYGEMKMRNFIEEVERIQKKQEGDRTLNEVAMLKQYQDEKWQEQFDYSYDYDDDENYNY